MSENRDMKKRVKIEISQKNGHNFSDIRVLTYFISLYNVILDVENDKRRIVVKKT